MERSWVIDHKQDVTIKFTLNPDGTGVFIGRFSNGKKIDGDHMYAKVTLVDAAGNIVGIGQHRVGINAAGWGKTKVRLESREFNIGPENAARVVSVIYDVGHFQGVDDAAFWKKVVDVGGLLIGGVENGLLVFPIGSQMKAGGPAVQF